ncbi:hypothetical protein [Methylobacter sp. sgz302048]|uniref:hypothetical protein n=1 Tax=Methylobacter sp. sgz302048 TaxID=3455945 RepID=UPI003FA0ACB2
MRFSLILKMPSRQEENKKAQNGLSITRSYVCPGSLKKSKDLDSDIEISGNQLTTSRTKLLAGRDGLITVGATPCRLEQRITLHRTLFLLPRYRFTRFNEAHQQRSEL